MRSLGLSPATVLIRDPTTLALSGDAIGANAKRLWSVFPDLAFDIVNLAEAGVGRVVAEWIMKGTNTESFQGLPATGRSISLPGVDVIEIGTDGIKAVTGLLRYAGRFESIGVTGVVQPFKVGLFSFGNSSAVQSGKKTKPGAFGITTIWNADAQTEEIRALDSGDGNGDVADGRLHRCGFLQDRRPRCNDLRMGKAGAHEAVNERRCPCGSHATVLGRIGRFGLHERMDS